MAEIQNKTYRLQIEEKTTDNLQDKKYPIIIGNSKRGKDALSKAISRTVKHRKGELECDISNMFFINEDEMEDGAKRLNDKFNKGLKIPAESIEKQLTSEAFGICPYTKSTKETWYPRYDGIPNHLWDCAYMTYIAIEFDGLKERILEN
jgi:ABC-type enterochelin transport system ATPase subunit